jgi:hypothetical protein
LSRHLLRLDFLLCRLGSLLLIIWWSQVVVEVEQEMAVEGAVALVDLELVLLCLLLPERLIP